MFECNVIYLVYFPCSQLGRLELITFVIRCATVNHWCSFAMQSLACL